MQKISRDTAHAGRNLGTNATPRIQSGVTHGSREGAVIRLSIRPCELNIRWVNNAKTEYARIDPPQPDCRRFPIRNGARRANAVTNRKAAKARARGHSRVKRPYLRNSRRAEGVARCPPPGPFGWRPEAIECRWRAHGRSRRASVWIAPGTSKARTI